MRRFACLCCMAALVGCARTENRAATDTATGAVAPTGESAAATSTAGTSNTVRLADVAGKWRVKAMTEAGDSVLGFVMTATADSSGWTNAYPNRRAPVPMRVVAVAGDSIVTEAGPYESVLRKGTQVRTHTVLRRQGDRLVGTTTARYQTTGPDTVRRFHMEGTRMP
jgi:hypothetical protein